MISANNDIRWPAEWEPHSCTLLTWPQRPELWSGRIEAVRAAYISIVRALIGDDPTNPDERVLVLVNDEPTRNAVRARFIEHEIECAPGGPVEFLTIATNDVWIRDYGPLRMYADSGNSAYMTSFQFTGWGGKFVADADNRAAEKIAAHFGERVRKDPDFVLEGGAIETNGRDLLITTGACRLHPNRNPNLSRDAIEARLRATLGIRDVLWLPNGLPGDDTDGHVDMITRLVGEETVLTCLPDDENHPAYAALAENLACLRDYRRPDGGVLKILELPMPPPRFAPDSDVPIPESYANFYIGNRAVLVPVFGDDATDQRALNIIAAAFPNRRVVAIPGSDLILEGGGIHCMTMQVPA